MSAAARVRIARDGAERAIDVAAGACTIGRAPGQVLRIVEEAVAPAHAVLHLGATWEVAAVGGAVIVEGVPLGRGGRAPLPRGGRVVIAGWTLIVEEPPAGAEPAGPLRTASLARELVRDLIGGADDGAAPSLVVDAGPSRGQQIVLPPPPSRRVLGRGEDADVVIVDPDLSRHHLAIERDGEGVRAIDLGSKNGSRIGDEAIPAEPPGRRLRAGETIACGATRLRLVDPAEEFLVALEGPTAATVPAAPAVSRPSLVPVAIAATIAAAAIVALILLLV